MWSLLRSSRRVLGRLMMIYICLEPGSDLGGRHQSAHYRRARYQSYQGNNIINQQRGVSCRSFHVFITRILQSWKVLY